MFSKWLLESIYIFRLSRNRLCFLVTKTTSKLIAGLQGPFKNKSNEKSTYKLKPLLINASYNLYNVCKRNDYQNTFILSFPNIKWNTRQMFFERSIVTKPSHPLLNPKLPNRWGGAPPASGGGLGRAPLWWRVWGELSLPCGELPFRWGFGGSSPSSGGWGELPLRWGFGGSSPPEGVWQTTERNNFWR